MSDDTPKVFGCFDTETQFIQTTLDELGIPVYAWCEMTKSDQERLLAELDRRREHVVILNP